MPVPMTPDVFGAPAERWVVTEQTPVGVADMLEVARSLYRHGFFVYEFVTVAVQHALVALEAALAHRLGRPNDSLGTLIKRAEVQGFIDQDEATLLSQGARRLRNGFGHAREQQVWTPGMAVPVVESVFGTVGALWPDD